MTNKKPNIKNNSISIYQNEAFDHGFYEYFKNLSRNKISQLLNNTDRKIKFETISYRTISGWENEGLITIPREGREWRKFSIIDALWVRIIKELREFGMSREQVKVVKQSLEFESTKCGVAMPMLEFYSALIIGARMPVLLLVFKDGIAIPCSFTQYKVAAEINSIQNHIQIDLNDLLQGMFPDIDLKPSKKPEMPLRVDEMELLAFLRVGEYEKVEIKYKDGRVDLIEGTEREMTTKVHTAINEKCYEEIKIRKRDDGVITSVVRTKRKKL